jgi:hydrogenase expression/formation protein HypD
MKHLDEYRDPALARQLVDRIRRHASRRWTLMEVCGGQTHSLLRHGIDQELDGLVDLLHGPGCPVCVTPAEQIDQACRLAQLPGVVVTSFGDMLRVPGRHSSLLQARRAGGDVRLVYSPLDAVKLAQRHPDRVVVFLAVGFETTVPATALAVLQATELGLTNFRILTAHVRVLPAMEVIAGEPTSQVQAFLAAGHVCTVAGHQVYDSFCERHRLPVVVTGFEPVDLLEGIWECVRQLEAGESHVVNAYQRSVRETGNESGQRLIERVYSVADVSWRGLGTIPDGGYQLRPEFARCDARLLLQEAFAPSADEPTVCPAREVLLGRLRPPDCPHFGGSCTPETPLGAPMVSGEGCCAAHYRYARSALEPRETLTGDDCDVK